MLLAKGEQIRRADQIMIEELGFPGVLLMEEAGRKSAEFILHQFPEQDQYLILTGPGNNGGDGLVIARYLHRAGKTVKILLSHPSDRFQGDAKINYQALQGSGIPLEQWTKDFSPEPGWAIVDALLGTGISDSLRGNILEIIELFHKFEGPVIAIDMPSGLVADHGEILSEPLNAVLTLTFQTAKLCHAIYPAAGYCGEVVVADIGIWPAVVAQLGIQRTWLQGEVVRNIIRNRPLEGHKGTFGHTLLIGGSSQYPGAIALSGHAALHIGAGLSTVVAPEKSRAAVFGLGPEVIFRALAGDTIGVEHLHAVLEWAEGKALGLGPGWSTQAAVKQFFLQFLERIDRPIVLDADALNLLAEEQCWELVPKGSVLTPHPGELRRLLQGAMGHRLEQAEALAKTHQLVVVLKGAGTIIATPEHTWVNSTGNSGMGTGGSGDVLTGVITGLLAQGYEPGEAAALGVYLHGLAGDRAAEEVGEAGLTASRIMEQLGPAMVNIIEHQEPQIPTI